MYMWMLLGCLLVSVLAGCQPVLPVNEVASGIEQQESGRVTAGSPAETTHGENTDIITATDVVTSAGPVMAVTDVPVSSAGGMPADSELVLAGMAVYRKQYCGICHELAAAETRGTFGPTHDGIGSRAALRIADAAYTGTAVTAAEYLRESILEPAAYLVEGYAVTSHAMPPYTHLDDSDVDALVAFLLAQQ